MAEPFIKKQDVREQEMCIRDRGAVVYPALICSVLGAGVLVRGYYSAYQKHRELDRIAQLSSELMEHFPEKRTAAEDVYKRQAGGYGCV